MIYIVMGLMGWRRMTRFLVVKERVIQKYKNGEIDPYTGAPISYKTAYTAYIMKNTFQEIENYKRGKEIMESVPANMWKTGDEDEWRNAMRIPKF